MVALVLASSDEMLKRDQPAIPSGVESRQAQITSSVLNLSSGRLVMILFPHILLLQYPFIASSARLNCWF